MKRMIGHSFLAIISLSILISIPAFAEGESSGNNGSFALAKDVEALTPVQRAMKSFEWSLIMDARRLNERYKEQDARGMNLPQGYWDMRFGEMDRLAMEKRTASERIDSLQSKVNFLENAVAQGLEMEPELGAARARLREANSDLREAQKNYNLEKKAGNEEVNQENQQLAHERRVALMRLAADRFASDTSALDGAQTLEFMKAIVSGWSPSQTWTAAVDKRLVYGPDVHINTLVRDIRERALDVLAQWGTKEAWEVIAKEGLGNRFPSVRDVALQHLMGEMTAPKYQALSGLAGSNPLVAKLLKAHEKKPHSFRQGKRFVDLQNLEAEPVEFTGVKNHPEMKGKAAKKRFFPEHEAFDPSKRGFREATAARAPSNRWSRLATRFRRWTKPVPKPKPVVEAPAETMAEVRPVQEGAAAPQVRVEVVPPAETSDTKLEETAPKKKRPPSFGNAWSSFLADLGARTRSQIPDAGCNYKKLGQPSPNYGPAQRHRRNR